MSGAQISTRRAYGVQRVCRGGTAPAPVCMRGGRRHGLLHCVVAAGRSALPRTTSWWPTFAGCSKPRRFMARATEKPGRSCGSRAFCSPGLSASRARSAVRPAAPRCRPTAARSRPARKAQAPALRCYFHASAPIAVIRGDVAQAPRMLALSVTTRRIPRPTCGRVPVRAYIAS